jgi:predicted nucleotidyltransferase
MKINDLKLDEETIKFSKTLNKDIWQGLSLKPIVKNKLQKIAFSFIEYLDLQLNIVDIHFTGSMANFNFNPDSDIDLHIIVNFSEYNIDPNMLQDYFNAKKTVFNSSHDITIYNHPVELYVEDSSNPAKSSGVYSILNDEWIKRPHKITQQIEDVKDSPKYLEFVERIKNILSSKYNTVEARNTMDDIYLMRSDGLVNGGELSEGNLIFKKLRSNGYIKTLKDYINKNYDESLSLY